MKAGKSQGFPFRTKLAKMKLDILLHTMFLCTLNTIFMLTGLFLNSIVITCFCGSSILRNRLNYFMIAVLACFDLAVVIVTHPLIMLSSMAWLFQKYEKFLRINWDISTILYGLSMASLLIMNVERYIALTYPYFHQRFVTKRKILTVLFVFQLLFSVLYILSYKHLVLPDGVTPVAFLSILFILLFYLNYKIYRIARRMRKSDDRMAASLQLNHDSNPPVHILTLKSKSTLKSTSTCLFAFLCFFVCCFPAYLRSCIGLVSKPLLSSDVSLGWTLWANTLVSMNSTFNCLIFFWKNTTLRNEGRNILKKWRIFHAESN